METNPLQQDQVLHVLARIADALEKLANNGKPVAPNYVRPISEYKTFDWASINAEVIRSDNDGPTHVSWNNLLFTRRSPVNKYEPAIFYSSPAGKDDAGETLYLRLIMFKTIKDADELPGKVSNLVKNGDKGRMDQTAYYAETDKRNISRQAADAIAALSSDDFELAVTRLEYFGKAKTVGLKFQDALSHFIQSGSDIKKAADTLPK